MKFERFLLDDYMQTPQGKKVYSFFADLKHIYFHNRKKFYNFVDSMLDISCAEEFLDKECSDFDERKFEKMKDIPTIEKYIRKKPNFWKKLSNYEARFCQREIPCFSVLEYLTHPNYAFPYLFPLHFYKFSEICRLFEIQIPVLPSRTQHLERIYYYYDLCRSLYNFRLEHNLTPVELCVFLYGFAIRFLEKFIEMELPEPNQIFMIGANEDDAEETLSKKLKKDTVFCWQGCSEILPGDIILLYERAPYKRIGSIWRAVSPGFDDPFYYYPGKVFMSYPIQNIPKVTFDDLKQDPVWSKNGLIRCNMQGIGLKNTAVTLEEYKALKKLFKKKNPSFNLEKLPEPPPYAKFFHNDLDDERDVEKKLLEPLLTKLGYNVKKDFTRQFPIRMGRGVSYYPDYALHATGKNGNERADFIWEAKYRIPTQKQLREDYGQAVSYARRLSCHGMGLVSQEGIWVSWEKDHFSFDKLRKYSWNELQNPDIFGKLKTAFHGI